MKIHNHVITSLPRLFIVQALGITLPNETPEKSFSIGSEMISESLAIRCSEALIQLLTGCIGYSYKEYKFTCALRQFSDYLRNANRSINQVNSYIQKGKSSILLLSHSLIYSIESELFIKR